MEIGLSAPYVLNGIKGIGHLTSNISATSPVGMHGSIFNGLFIGDREVTAYYTVHGKCAEDAYEKSIHLGNICSSASASNGEQGRLEYENEYGTWWIPAIVKKGPGTETIVGKRFIMDTLIFHCPDPFWREEFPQTEKLAFLGGGLQFPLSIDHRKGVAFGSRKNIGVINNYGDTPAPVIIRITGPAKKPIINKMNTGEYIRLNTNIPEGAYLEINTYMKTLSVVIVDDGNRQDAIGYIALDSTFFQLLPGTTKIGYMSEDDANQTQVYLESYSRFGGV